MLYANIRKGDSIVLLKPPYSTFVPAQFQIKQLSSVPNYIAFEGVQVVFSGIGTNSVIEFHNRDRVQNIVVPNESILVIPR